MTAKVVNLRDYRRTDGMGAAQISPFALPADVVRIDRRSKWGNPFPIGTHNGVTLSRFEALVAYETWLDVKLAQEPGYLEPLRGKRLACWCRPPEGFRGQILCHGQIIVGELYDVPAETVE